MNYNTCNAEQKCNPILTIRDQDTLIFFYKKSIGLQFEVISEIEKAQNENTIHNNRIFEIENTENE